MSQKPSPLVARGLAALEAAVAKLQAAPPPSEVRCPIFGNAPAPAAPSTEGLPPQLALASQQLAEALASPPSLGDKWPFANPPAVQAQIEAAKKKGGRPSTVQPNVVVRLVRWTGQGKPVTEVAAKLGISRRLAYLLLSGQHPAAHSAAVEAAGVLLPPMKAREPVQKPCKNPEQGLGDTQVATEQENASKARSCDSPKTGGAA